MSRSTRWDMFFWGFGGFAAGLIWVFVCTWFGFRSGNGEFVKEAMEGWKIVGYSLLGIIAGLALSVKRSPLRPLGLCIAAIAVLGFAVGIAHVFYICLVELWYNSLWVLASIPGWIIAAFGLLLMLGATVTTES